MIGKEGKELADQEKMRIFVAPLGNPKGYKQRRYRLKDGPKEGILSSAIIAEEIRPDKILFIVGDTLAESYEIKDEDYRRMTQKIEEEVKRFLKGQLKSDGYEILTAPAVITRGNYSFIGEMLDYYYYILYHLALILVEGKSKCIDMHVDVTHGVNYMTILCYRAVIDILGWLALFHKVNITVYNSDPVLGDKEEYILNINQIENREIMGRPLQEMFSNNARPIYLSSGDGKEISNRFKLLSMKKSEINAFIGSIYNGLPLALYTFYNESSDIKNIIDIALDMFRENIDLKMDDGLRVERKASFTNDFKICVYAYITSRLLEEQHCIDRLDEAKGIDINTIEKITREFFKYDERLSNRIDKDLHDIKCNVEKNKGKASKWISYIELIGKSRGEPDERNFLAHSGFEHNLIEVVSNGEIRLRYRYDEEHKKKETIMKFCRKGLSEGKLRY